MKKFNFLFLATGIVALTAMTSCTKKEAMTPTSSTTAAETKNTMRKSGSTYLGTYWRSPGGFLSGCIPSSDVCAYIIGLPRATTDPSVFLWTPESGRTTVELNGYTANGLVTHQYSSITETVDANGYSSFNGAQ